MNRREQRQLARNADLDPEPRNAVDERLTNATGNPRASRIGLTAAAVAFMAGGLGCLLYALWYTASAATAGILSLVGVAAVIIGAFCAASSRRGRDELVPDVNVEGRAYQKTLYPNTTEPAEMSRETVPLERHR